MESYAARMVGTLPEFDKITLAEGSELREVTEEDLTFRVG